MLVINLMTEYDVVAACVPWEHDEKVQFFLL